MPQKRPPSLYTQNNPWRSAAAPGPSAAASGAEGGDKDSAEQFVGSVFKFSIATFANMFIYALFFIITNFYVAEETLGQVELFTGFTNTLMTVAVLGLDQALMRFYREPPAGVSQNSLFRHCVYFSGTFLLFGMLMGSTIFARPLYGYIGFETVGLWVMPLLFLNAAFFLVARYFNVLFRLEMNVKTYTIQSIVMQFFYKLFYMVGAFFPNPDEAMMLCSAAGLGALAVVLVFIRRKTLRPHPAGLRGGVYKTVLPFGLAVAPTAIFVTLNGNVAKSIITSFLGLAATGRYSFAFAMSSVVTMVQGGFAAFWAPYMYANYKTHQARIMKVHDFINFVILTFFCVLVAFEDVIFWVFKQYSPSMLIFPLMMFSAVFNILTETTVHGNAIARKPIFDTIGIALGACINFAMCFALIPQFNLVGAAVALVIGNGASYLLRTLTAQRLYRSIPSPGKTAMALLIGAAVAAAGTVFSGQFVVKGLCCLAAIGLYCLMYRKELVRLCKILLSLAKSVWAHLFKRGAA
ncbi:hypothetical protein LJC04_05140 [Ruminococcaceae bacterium OttesenSCG-928-O06]|nr:hypothetical protein [Ruminococcaceae bacterium OttesenSCG-928-O06]